MKLRFLIAPLLLIACAATVVAQDLGEAARKERERQAAIKQKPKVYTNADVATFHPSEPSSPEKTAAKPDEKVADHEGHDERYWSEKFLAARRRLSDAQEKESRLAGQIKDYSYRLLNQTDVYDREHLYPPLIQEHQQELDKNKQEIADAQAALDSLYDQLRKAGAPASWADSKLAETPPAPASPTREYYEEQLKRLDEKYDAMAHPYREERFRLINRHIPAKDEPLDVDTSSLGIGIDPSIPQLDAKIKEIEDSHQEARRNLILQAQRAGFNIS